jgi:uncharacterized protein (DUF983 family)
MKKLLRVQCPRCGWKQVTSTKRIVTCHRCGHHYTIIPKKKLSRIVRIVWVGKKDYIEAIPVEYVPASQLRKRAK